MPKNRQKIREIKMTEYELFGVLFFGWLFLTVIITTIWIGIENAIKKAQKRHRVKKTRKVIKEHKRVLKTQKYAEFVAIASAYGKGV